MIRQLLQLNSPLSILILTIPLFLTCKKDDDDVGKETFLVEKYSGLMIEVVNSDTLISSAEVTIQHQTKHIADRKDTIIVYFPFLYANDTIGYPFYFESTNADSTVYHDLHFPGSKTLTQYLESDSMIMHIDQHDYLFGSYITWHFSGEKE